MWPDLKMKLSGDSASGRDAAWWFARMRSDTRSIEDETAFERWLAEDPAHEQDYLNLQAVWGDMDRFGESPEIAAARKTAVSDSRRTEGSMRWLARLGGARLALTGATVAASLAIGFLFANFGIYSDATYRTAIGDRQTVRLNDGSEVTLNTDSVLRVHYRPWTREVTLERGQGFFKVAHSSIRTFEVAAGNSRVRAVGTAFDVFLQDGAVKVTLVEGRVEVDGPSSDASLPPYPVRAELSSGQSVAVRAAGLSAIQTASLAKATAWLEGRLVFENEPLRDVVAEVNRYSPVRLVILDEALADLRISGVFRAGRAETFVDALQASFSIETRQTTDGTLIIEPVKPAT